MWKKFLAAVALVGVLSTATVSALGVDTGTGTGDIPSYIDNFTMTPNTFSPGSNPAEIAEISFDLSAALDVYAYAINSNYEIVATFANYEDTPAGHVTYTWHGRAGNSIGGAVLPIGTYTIKAFAAEDGEILDFDYKEVTITTATAPDAPVISNLTVDPLIFSAQDSENTEISFDVDANAYLDVDILMSGGTTVKTFSDYSGNDWYQSTATHSINWNGINDGGTIVGDGVYTIVVTASNNDGTSSAEITVEVKTTGTVSDGVIEDFQLTPSGTWDPTDEELEIEFDLTSDVRSLIIEARKGYKVIEILDNDWVDSDDYHEFWDGTDEDGDYVDEGIWEITIRADGDEVMQTITVEYERPEITFALVTKESFDPYEDEFTHLIFEVDANAIVTVEIYKGSHREFKLLDDEEVSKNRYYTVKWDGTDDDGDEVDYGQDWKFKITAENEIDDDIFSTETVEVDVEEDYVSDRKSNVTNDYTDPVVFDEDNSMEISYCLDRDAEVFLAVYKGESASGGAEIELLDYVDQHDDCYVVDWNGRDDEGRDLRDGVYSYKLISKIGTYKDTEIGRFVVGNVGDSTPPDTTCPDGMVPDGHGGCTFPSGPGECALYYWDLSYLTGSNELCEAIAWVTEEGIFSGYPDGSFKPYQDINRAEVLKVVLEAFDIDLLPITGYNEGFSDVEPYAWYMPYLRTAVYYGMFHGYPDGTARLTNTINRVELLKFVLEASSRFTGYEFSTGYRHDFYADVDSSNPETAWFYEYANAAYLYDLLNSYFVGGQEYLMPGDLVERGEVALLLYRMAKAGLLL